MADDRPERIVITIRPGLHITQTCFTVGTRHYALAALSGLHTRQSGRHPLPRTAALLASAGLIALITSARFMHPLGIAATALALLGLLIVAAAGLRLRPRRQELWATYRGRLTPIFASENTWLFGAVERQLRRSLTEVHRGMRQLPPPTRPAPAVPHPSTMHPSTMRAAF